MSDTKCASAGPGWSSRKRTERQPADLIGFRREGGEVLCPVGFRFFERGIQNKNMELLTYDESRGDIAEGGARAQPRSSSIPSTEVPDGSSSLPGGMIASKSA